MGWLRGDLSRAPGMLADVAPPAPAPEKPAADLPLEDQKVLDALSMLLDLELLEGWDPKEDLPIPVQPAPRQPQGPTELDKAR